MADQAPIVKIYELCTLGYDEVMQQFNNVTAALNNIKKAKQDASRAAADAATSQGEESQAYRMQLRLMMW